MKTTLTFLALFILLSLNSCKDEPVEPNNRAPGLYVTLRDVETKEILQNKGVEVFYYADTAGIIMKTDLHNFPNPFMDLTTIFFEQNESSRTLIYISGENGDIDTIMDDNLTAGAHSVQIDFNNNLLKDYTPGFYQMTLEMGSTKLTGELFYLPFISIASPGSANNYPLALRQTDAMGNAFFEFSLFKFVGKKYERTLENGNYLGVMEIKKAAYLEVDLQGYEPVEKLVELDENKAVDIEIKLKKVY